MPFALKFGLGEYFSFAYTSGEALRGDTDSCRNAITNHRDPSLQRSSDVHQSPSNSHSNDVAKTTHGSESRIDIADEDDEERLIDEDTDEMAESAEEGSGRRNKRKRDTTPKLVSEKVLQERVAAECARCEARLHNPTTAFFSKLPPEVRLLIYENLLCSSQQIDKFGSKLGAKRVQCKMSGTFHPVPVVDSTILRTCHAIYDEALPLLYGRNTFLFTTPEKITNFQFSILDDKFSWASAQYGLSVPGTLKFGLQRNDQGRLALIRSIGLKITSKRLYLFNDLQKNREAICRQWLHFLVPEDRIIARTQFPVLVNLELDFREWRLGPDEGLFVDPFIQCFSQFGSGRMERLLIRVIKHESTLEAFRNGLVAKSGELVVAD